MAIFKCKICGGALEIDSTQSVATCQYCGTKQTLPKLDDERKATLYDRANHFRRNNDFDKAMSIYEQILNEDNTDAESYWSIVLCRYGIEYVEDPTTRKRVITVNRTQFTSIFDDEDYKSAIYYADGYQRKIYETEANTINEIQKGIIAISQREEPFDVFICYKETDNNGRRTHDSVLATELYHELTREGFKVFFSRITLEDKLGIAYEPYIFAALNSAKVMVVIGTRPEHFNAVWVRNEWSRYLSLIKNGAKKMLIPAYRDMDPYDLPEEFAHLQAQDMSKLGFMQDLVRGIKKIVTIDTHSTTTQDNTTNTISTIDPLIKRIFLLLEDEEWEKADELCERVLNLNPECPEAYLGKLMIELKVSKRKNLGNLEFAFDKEKNYLKVLRYGDEVIRTELQGYIKTIYKRNEDKFREEIYQKARKKQSNAIDKISLQEAVELYDKIINYKDSREQKEICQSKIQNIKQQEAEREERLKEQVKAREEKDILQTDIKYKKHKILFTCTVVFLIVSPILLIFACFSPTPTLAIIFVFLFLTALLCIAIPFQKYRYVKAKKYYYDKKYYNAADIFEQMEGNPHNKFMDVSTWKRKALIAAGDPSNIAYSNYKKKQRRKEKFIIAGITAAIILAIALVVVIVISADSNKYDEVAELYKAGNIEEANQKLLEMESFTLSKLVDLGVTDIVIPDGVTALKKSNLEGCEELTSIVIPNSVTSIEKGTFANCTKIESITIPFIGSSSTVEDAESFGYIFDDGSLFMTGNSDVPTSLKNVVISGGTTISDDSFRDCHSIETITIAASVTKIEEYAFIYCYALKNVIIEEGSQLNTIEARSFNDCKILKTITFGGTMQQWNSIKKEGIWNNNTGAYTVVCTDGTISKENS